MRWPSTKVGGEPVDKYVKWCAGKYLTSSFLTKRALICSIHRFSQFKYSHRSWFQATSWMSLNTVLARGVHNRLSSWDKQATHLFNLLSGQPEAHSMHLFSPAVPSETEPSLPGAVNNVITHLWITPPPFPMSLSPVLLTPGITSHKKQLAGEQYRRLFLGKSKERQKLFWDMTIQGNLDFSLLVFFNVLSFSYQTCHLCNLKENKLFKIVGKFYIS